MAIAVLIPAYNPDQQLLAFAAELFAPTGEFAHIVVVNDGSRQELKPVFAQLAAMPGVSVLHHAINLGKGAALKTGLNHCALLKGPLTGVVTADADGQHLPEDVVAVAGITSPSGLADPGRRSFGADVPLRSKFGNLVTRYVFRGLVGAKVTDTQTGLRGIPRRVARELLRLRTGGYEFELDMLIHCRQQNVPFRECPIQTVYLDNNSSSHFNPLLDSLRIYFVLLRFMTSSVATACVDYLVFLLTYSLTANVLISHGLARAAATGVNFALVRKLVFHSRERVGSSLPKFIALVLVMATFTYLLIESFIHGLGWGVLPAKVIAELLGYAANFTIQRNFIFNQVERPDAPQFEVVADVDPAFEIRRAA